MTSQLISRHRYSVCGLACAVLLLGCAEESIDYREVKRPNEILLASEWRAFVNIVKQLPEPQLQQFPNPQLPPPQWHQARTLPVDELAAEERGLLEKSLSPVRPARELSRNVELLQLLREEHLTMEQFVGVIRTLGEAMRRAALPDDFPLSDIIRRGKARLDHLSRDKRLFASLSVEDRHRVLDEAIWLHRVQQAELMQSIPESNISLVRRHAAWLTKIMPEHFHHPPFEDASALLEEQGLPFIELPETGSDEQLEWSLQDAIVGTSALGSDG